MLMHDLVFYIHYFRAALRQQLLCLGGEMVRVLRGIVVHRLHRLFGLLRIVVLIDNSAKIVVHHSFASKGSGFDCHGCASVARRTSGARLGCFNLEDAVFVDRNGL